MTEAIERDSRSRTDPLIFAVRAHESGARDWSFSGIAARMNRLYDQLNAEFFAGKLPAALITIGPDLIVRRGHYHAGRNGLGVKHHIHMNSKWFGRPELEVAADLLHQCVHMYQKLFGRVGHRQRYHSKQFVDLAAACGLRVRVGNGETLQIGRRLRRKLDQFGFSEFEPMIPDQKAEPIQKPQRKVMWKCMCGQMVWAEKGDHIEIICKICHSTFERPEELTTPDEEVDLAIAEAA